MIVSSDFPAVEGIDGIDVGQILDQSPELICLHDLSGRYVFVNATAKELTGWSPEDLINRDPYEFFHPDDIDRIRQMSHDLAIQDDQFTIIDYRFRKADGSYVWLETMTQTISDPVTNEMRLLHTSSRDISHQVKLRQRLQIQTDIWEEASQMGRIGSWHINLGTNHVHWSEVVFEIHGLDPEQGVEIELERAIRFYPGEARDIIRQKVIDCTQKGIPYDVRLPFINAKGKELFVRAIGKAKLKEGKVVKVYGLFQDITPEHHLQKKFEQANRKLRVQNDQLMDFNHIIAHNLRAPIASLSVINQMLQEVDAPEKLESFKSMLQELSETMQATVDDLLDVVRIRQLEEREMAELVFEEVLAKILRLLNPQINRQEAIIETNFEALPRIVYSPKFLESILLNLLSNALKYAHPDRAPHIIIRTFRNGDQQLMAVSDNGLGIDLERNGHKVFKLYKTFHRHRRGKGFGLFLIKNQIEALGGSIQVESKVNVGTTFTISFND